MSHNFPKEILKILNKLKTPSQIQAYIDTNIEYDPYREDRTLVEICKDNKGECYNGALFAVSALQNINIEAGLVLLTPYEDEEHILAVYKENGMLGAIAQSKFLGLKSREPIYLNIHDLAVSYKEFYYSFDGFYSLAGYSDYFDISKYNNKWVNKRNIVVKMEEDLLSSKTHQLLKTDKKVYVSPERYWKEIEFIPKGTKIPKRYRDFKRNKR